MRLLRLNQLLLLIFLGSCTQYDPKLLIVEGNFQWQVPSNFPLPKEKSDNVMSVEKVKLGRYLFYDKRLSENMTQSCSSCHSQARGFAQGLPASFGSTGEVTSRNAMAIVNLAYMPVFTWNNNLILRLKQQALLPIFAEDPVELGFAGKHEILLSRIADDEFYVELFARSFPLATKKVTLETITKSLEAFQRSIVSFNSPYDQYKAGNTAAISDAAKRGAGVFFTEKVECFHCHNGINFTLNEDFEGKIEPQIEFHNTGLYNIGPNNRYTSQNPGLKEVSTKDSDEGKFKTPTLRNIALSFPYMHDGSIGCSVGNQDHFDNCASEALTNVIDHYADGGRNCTDANCTSTDRNNRRVSSFVPGFKPTGTEVSDILAFLKSLTDCDFVNNEAYSNPWPVGSSNHLSVETLPNGHPCSN